MEKKLVVANWKGYKTVSEAQEWMKEFRAMIVVQQLNNVSVVICPSFVVLPRMADEVSKLEGVKLGAQDVSKFGEGQYTGEVSAKMLRDFVSFVIVGHSERRKYFGETGEDVGRKVEQCLKYDLIPIVCVSSVQELSSFPSDLACRQAGLNPNGTIFAYAYEPLSAVGTGEPDTPENAQEFALKIKKEISRDIRVLYGGSVNAKNAKSFVSQSDIDGVLVGQASLDAEEFADIIKTTEQENKGTL